MNEDRTIQLATFGAGCFWGVEESFRTLKGVLKTEVGYSGGHLDNPTYKDVCTDQTGHAEVVQVTFNPDEISYEFLLNIFWSSHNPTTLNRQGPDVGAQYRSVIFYHNDQQRISAEQSKKSLQESGQYRSKIVTQIEPAQKFYPAEDYHQQYLHKRGLGSCHL
jgi:peptide-methionine (S)-S-oxide reductase